MFLCTLYIYALLVLNNVKKLQKLLRIFCTIDFFPAQLTFSIFLIFFFDAIDFYMIAQFKGNCKKNMHNIFSNLVSQIFDAIHFYMIQPLDSRYKNSFSWYYTYFIESRKIICKV